MALRTSLARTFLALGLLLTVVASCVDGTMVAPSASDTVEAPGPADGAPVATPDYGPGPTSNGSAQGPTAGAPVAGPQPDRHGAGEGLGVPGGAAPAPAGTGAVLRGDESIILWQNLDSGERSAWWMEGQAATGGTVLSSVPPHWTVDAAGDLNHDGMPDLIWTNQTSGARYVWYMGRNGDIGGGSLSSVGPHWTIDGLGDFDRNGSLDIVWSNTRTGQRYVWFQRGDVNVGGISLGSVPVHWRIVGARDMTGNGSPDILWQNMKTGVIYLWFQDGVRNIGGAALSTVAAPWSIGALSVDPARTLTITTGAALPDGFTEEAYSAVLGATEGYDETTRWLRSGGSLPPGLELSSDGRLTGTPTEAGTFRFTVEARNGSQVAARDFTLRVLSPLVISTDAALPAAIVDLDYSTMLRAAGCGLRAAGGDGEYTWEFVSGELPVGLKLRPGGRLHGTPSFSSFRFEFGFRARVTSAGTSVERDFVLFLRFPTMVTQPILRAGVLDAPYDEEVEVAGGDGEFTFTLQSGELPPGLTFNEGTARRWGGVSGVAPPNGSGRMSSEGEGAPGTLSGTPTERGTWTFTVDVTSAGSTATEVMTVSVFDPVRLVTERVPSGRHTLPYTHTLTASGGTGEYRFDVVGGALPEGLTLARSGEISGTPTQLGRFDVEVEVRSLQSRSQQIRDRRVVRLDVFRRVRVTVERMPDQWLGEPVFGDPRITISGGESGAFQWAVASGRLPAGTALEDTQWSTSNEVVLTLRGRPTESGTFQVRLHGSRNGEFADALVTLVVHEPPSVTLPEAVSGEPYAADLKLPGGAAAQYRIVSQEAGAEDLTITPSGWVQGTPVRPSGGNVRFRAEWRDGDARGYVDFAIPLKGFRIVFEVEPSPLPWVNSAIENAMAASVWRWERVIRGFVHPRRGTLRISVSFEAYENRILAKAGPTEYGSVEGNPLIFSTAGRIGVDIAAMDGYDFEDLVSVLTHEIGHILGIGRKLLRDNGLITCTDDALNAQYYGPRGLAGARAVGVGHSSIIEIDRESSNCAHWDEEIFGHEMMTPIFTSGQRTPISVLTLGALHDLGFVVDYSRAEAYELGAPAAAPGAAAGREIRIHGGG